MTLDNKLLDLFFAQPLNGTEMGEDTGARRLALVGVAEGFGDLQVAVKRGSGLKVCKMEMVCRDKSFNVKVQRRAVAT
ncbi:MAG: hypothetical protein RQ722_10555 [Desulfuromonadales bacterium]|nr:hypothetical protein [Desulfuromonadales bacterium]